MSLDKVKTLYVGGVLASGESLVIRTLVGSCIACCLFDPVARVGGMNHFLLPDGDGPRFGVQAMDRLVAAIQKAGGDRRRLVAKLFGGAHVVAELDDSPDSPPRRNVAFVREYARVEAIDVVAEDLGGNDARLVRFHADTGKAFVRRITAEAPRRRVWEREQRRRAEPAPASDVVLFLPE